MAEIGNVTVRVDAVITDEQYHEAMSAVSAANEYIAALDAENAKLRELAKELFKLADRGLMELDDDDFRRIVDEAEKLGVDDG